jgi:hypothetical protein
MTRRASSHRLSVQDRAVRGLTDIGCFNTLELRGDSWTVLGVNELPAGTAE